MAPVVKVTECWAGCLLFWPWLSAFRLTAALSASSDCDYAREVKPPWRISSMACGQLKFH